MKVSLLRDLDLIISLFAKYSNFHKCQILEGTLFWEDIFQATVVLNSSQNCSIIICLTLCLMSLLHCKLCMEKAFCPLNLKNMKKYFQLLNTRTLRQGSKPNVFLVSSRIWYIQIIFLPRVNVSFQFAWFPRSYESKIVHKPFLICKTCSVIAYAAIHILHSNKLY